MPPTSARGVAKLVNIIYLNALTFYSAVKQTAQVIEVPGLVNYVQVGAELLSTEPFPAENSALELRAQSAQYI